ncbi:MAG: amidohydrolase family protein [Verrucomicrobiales bacterium]|nr:amidohydrolase family protein [Verrucomicrobiales bacterium]
MSACCLAASSLVAADAPPPAGDPELWRAQHRLIDLHQHIDFTPDHLARAVRILDRAGIGVGVNLSGGTVTQTNGAPSEFEQNKAISDRLAPGRFVLYFNLDYSGWDQPSWPENAARQVDEARRMGAAGFKQDKRLGLYLRNAAGELLKIDDPKLDPVWRRCGELGLPVSIHVADPRAFWLPFSESNERWKELRDHRPWWFGDPKVYPPREELLAALDRVISRHPGTTFVCVHFANNAEDIDWVEQALDQHPNMHADLAARVPEIGRHPPEKVRKLFVKHQNRIFFATDFQVYDKLILGSSGDDERPTDDDAVEFYRKHWRWLESNDRNFPHMTPIQGDWTISAIGLPPDVLRKVYFDNARQLLARDLPTPVLRATRIPSNPQGPPGPRDPLWDKAAPVWIEQDSLSGQARPSLATEVRALWTADALILRFVAPFTKLTTFDPPASGEERIGLWERDVVEAFIGTDAAEPKRYDEFQAAPNGMKLDLRLNGEARDFKWDSGMSVQAEIRDSDKIWTAIKSIPLKSLTSSPPKPGSRWRINLYRCDYANDAFLTWRPTLKKTFHVPDRFGVLEFGD